MKNDEFLSALNAELNSADLPMSEKLKAEPILAAENGKNEGAGSRSPRKNRRLWLSVAACSAAACVAAICIASALAPAAPPVEALGACMSLSINPAVSVLLDSENKVKKVLSDNSDGDTLLQDSEFVASLTGLSAAEAAKKLAERAGQSGYFDLLADGTDGKYNQIEVGFEGAELPDGSVVSAVKNTLTQYFKEKGVFVYVETSQTAREDFQEYLASLEKRATEWLDHSAGEETKTALKDSAYGFAADALKHSFAKYDLYQAIYAKNAEIVAQTGGIFAEGSSYWELTDDDLLDETVSALEAEMDLLLDQMYYGFGEDYRVDRGDPLFSLTGWILGEKFGTMYEGSMKVEAAAEALAIYRETDISQTGVRTEHLGAFVAFTTMHGYGGGVINALQSALGAVADWVQEQAGAYIERMQGFIADWSQGLYETYAEAFNEGREEISDERYEEFLEKIQKN
ncbi:MAG: hypothetical protein IJX98_01290 [Clostridia bacterium]|nr:hypothetical protein [Clostridia bacterium]